MGMLTKNNQVIAITSKRLTTLVVLMTKRCHCLAYPLIHSHNVGKSAVVDENPSCKPLLLMVICHSWVKSQEGKSLSSTFPPSIARNCQGTITIRTFGLWGYSLT